jgi:hypothetical protein
MAILTADLMGRPDDNRPLQEQLRNNDRPPSARPRPMFPLHISNVEEAELLPHLPRGHLVVLNDYGHGDSATGQVSALDHLLAGFLKDGTVDASLYKYSPIPFH